MEKLSITQLKEDERPRERLLALGPGELTNPELLAILIGSGSPTENAVRLMERVLADCDHNLNTLGKMTIEQLCRYNGIGPAKAVTIQAACELGKRRQLETVKEREKATSSRDIYEYFSTKLQDLPYEECHVLLLNHALRVIGSKCVGRGGITGTVVDVRLVLREALLAHATAIALCHNHPSGNVTPSKEDDNLTLRMAKAATAVDIRFLDHVVLTDGNYYSYNDKGRL
ncbi:MAG: DNA repair protein RadC [Bacteroidales bacterium]|nr:DNA repair protein RadC [Bacteroidales bacterium]